MNQSSEMKDETDKMQYYRKVAASYRNPFFPGIKKVRQIRSARGGRLEWRLIMDR
jgi:hypothetical protein